MIMPSVPKYMGHLLSSRDLVEVTAPENNYFLMCLTLLCYLFGGGGHSVNMKAWVSFNIGRAAHQNFLLLVILPLSSQILQTSYFCVGQKKMGICLKILSEYSFIIF